MEFVVSADLDGARADRACAALAGLSRSAARSLFAAGRVTVDGIVVSPSDAVRSGSVVSVEMGEPEPGLVPDAGVPFSIIYEDDAVMVVDKPAGVVVHPGAGTVSATLAAGLIAARPALASIDRWGLVHRLDKDTSGLLVVAKSAHAQQTLQEALRARQVHRGYLALVEGVFDNATGTIEAPIGRDPSHPTRMTVLRDGRPARTHYRRLATWGEAGVTLLDVELESGRTHQIRVHLGAIGHPVVGDRTYGRSGGPGDPGRTWLHAIVLTFAHPVTGEDLSVRSALPDDLQASLEALGRPTGGAVPVD